MLPVGLLVPHKDKFEYFDRVLVILVWEIPVIWQEILCIGQDLGHKYLKITVILDLVSRPENLLPLILMYIFGRAYSDIIDVHKDCFWCVLLNPSVCMSLEELIEM